MMTGKRQDGLASIVIVFMLTIIISLLTLGFSRLMDRAIQNSTGNDLNAAADYAVRVGINEAASYIKAFPSNGAKNCDDLTKKGQPLAKPGGLSGDDSVKYTCVLINTQPQDLFYQLLTPYKSQISQITPDQNMSQMMVSWESTDRTFNLFPPADGTTYNETDWWQKHYPAVIRLTLYPVSGMKNQQTAWNNLNDTTNNVTRFKTVYLFPSASNPTGNSSALITRADWRSMPDGSKFSVNCGTTKTDANPPAPAFVGKTTYDCNMIFFDLPSQAAGDPNPYSYYARITPLYSTGTNFRIQGQGSLGLVKFTGSQSIVDVTAKAGSAAKRLQARVDIISSDFVDPQLRPSEDASPEYAVRAADTICKVFLVPDSKTADVVIPSNITGTYNGACPTDYPASQ